jgi:hypothetical protein
LAVFLVVAGGRKGRRKPGQGEPGENGSDDGRDAQSGQRGRDSAAETGDAEAEQWLNPFRIGRPVTPVISPRRAAAPSGAQPPGGADQGSAPEPLLARPVYPEPVQVDPVRSDLPRQVWHEAEPPGQIWHDPDPGQDWEQPAQQPPQTLRLRPGDGYESADGPYPSRQGALGYGPPGGPVEPGLGYHGGYGPPAGYVHDDRGSYPRDDERAGRHGRGAQPGQWTPAVPGVFDGSLGPGGLPVRRPRGVGQEDGGPVQGAGYGAGQGGNYGPRDGFDPQARSSQAGRPAGPRRPDARSGPGADGASVGPDRVSPPGGAGVQGGFGSSQSRRGRFTGQGGHGDYGDAPPNGYGSPPGYGHGAAPPEYGRSRDYGRSPDYVGSPDYVDSPNYDGPSGHGGPAGYDGPQGYAEPRGYDGHGSYQQREGRFAAEGGRANASDGAGRTRPGNYVGPDAYDAGRRGHLRNDAPADAPGYRGTYGPPDGRVRRGGYGRPADYGEQVPPGMPDGYGPAPGGRPDRPPRTGIRRQPGGGAAPGGFQIPGGQYPRSDWRPENGVQDGYRQSGRPQRDRGSDPRGQSRPPPGYPAEASYRRADAYTGDQSEWPYEGYDAPPGYQQGDRQHGREGGFQGPADPRRHGRYGWGSQESGQPGRPMMPADPGWQSQAGRQPPGSGSRRGGDGPPGRRRAGPWPPDAGYGYGPGEPAPLPYDPDMRDGYPGHDARYPNQQGGYAGGPMPDDHRTGGSRPGWAVPTGSGAERARQDGDAGQRAAAGKTSQKRRTGPPAALPPGPSASRARESAPERASAGSQSRDHNVDAADSPGSALSAAGVSAPPSPSGIIPPAIGEVPKSARPDAGTNAAGDPSDEVGPDDETTPMAVILGGKADDQQPAAEAKPHVPSGLPAKRMRGPFEPPDKVDPVEAGTPPSDPTTDESAGDSAEVTTMSDAARASLWSPGAAKMDQIKDLYLTAEAIGEDALDQNFELVSDRQRQLIKEYFNEIGAGRADSHDAAS